MLNCDLLGVGLKCRLERIKLSEIECCAPVQASGQEKAQLAELGQVMPLIVIGNPAGTYNLLSGDTPYSAMLGQKKSGNRSRLANCLVVEPTPPGNAIRELMVEYHCLELGCGNPDEHKLRIVDLLLELASIGTIKRSSLLAIVAELFGQSKRYARMYITIASCAIPELREAIIVPSSGRREKSPHIPVQQAAQIANLPPEGQRAELERLRSGTASNSSAVKPANRKAAEAWLSSLEELVSRGTLLCEEDANLLKKAEQLYQQLC